ncbi:MAG: RNA polymerase sigma factor region1.1 domain-containing protein, partial [Pseudomonas marincola]
MATKSAEAVETTEQREETPDSPLIDASQAAVKKMLNKAKEKGFVTFDELNAVLPQDQMSSEQIEDTMSLLSEMGINVVENEEAAEEASSEGGDQETVEETATEKVPEKAASTTGDRTDDPVRMYLREMGTVELLSREGEIAIAKRIEAGRGKMIGAICESPLTIRAILNWRELMLQEQLLLRDVIDLDATYGAGAAAEKALQEGFNEESEDETTPAADLTEDGKEEETKEEETKEEPELDEEGNPVRREEEEEEEAEENTMSLAALEETLKPQVFERFDEIAKTYKKLHKLQETRLTAALENDVVPKTQEKKYDKLKAELVRLMDDV